MSDATGQLKSLKSATIMIVDDEPTTIDILVALLQEDGYAKFVTTTDSRRALSMLRKEDPHVLLLDLVMPYLGGFEILSAMRQSEALKNLPVVIMTSATDPETKLEALELGATDFLGKPIDPSELALRLRSTLALKFYRDRLGSERKKERRVLGRSTNTGPPIESRLAGTPRFRAIIEKFIVRLELKLVAMEASWEERDYDELANLAHWLKGAAGTVGFDALTAPAESLKLYAIEYKESEIESSLLGLRGLCERIVASNESEPNDPES